MEDRTKPLYGQTEPLFTPNTYNHCVILIENNRQGPVLIRISLTWMITQNHFVDRQNYYVHPTLTTTV